VCLALDTGTVHKRLGKKKSLKDSNRKESSKHGQRTCGGARSKDPVLKAGFSGVKKVTDSERREGGGCEI